MQTSFYNKVQERLEAKNVLPFSACGEELRKEKGSIESPNYPSTYPANAACVWIITVPTGYQVHFEIQNIQVSLIH